MPNNNTKTPRLFRLRNGITVQEHHYSFVYDQVGNFTDKYAGATQEDKQAIENLINRPDYFTLYLQFDGNFPRGGHHGPDFDIVEELTSAKKEK